MADQEPDPDYLLYVRAMNDPEFEQIFLQEMGEHDPDYVAEGSDEEEEEEEDEEEEGEEEPVEELEEEEAEGDDSSIEVLGTTYVSSSRVLEDTGAGTLSQGGVIVVDVQGSGNSIEEFAKPSQENTKEGETNEGIFGGEEWSRNKIDGLFCPICMEAWTSGGDHQVWSVQLRSLFV